MITVMMTRMMYPARRGSTATTTGPDTAKTCLNTAKTSPRSRARSERDLQCDIEDAALRHCRGLHAVREYVVSILTNISTRLYDIYLDQKYLSITREVLKREYVYLCNKGHRFLCIVSIWLHCIIGISLTQVCPFILRVFKQCLSYIARV